MIDTEAAALLPPGIADVLPPDAAFEAATLEHLMAFFAGFGYQRVKPPLIEFEETLLGGLGTAVTQDTFRLMDPASQRMLAVRADMTPQLARIATTRLGGKETGVESPPVKGGGGAGLNGLLAKWVPSPPG